MKKKLKAGRTRSITAAFLFVMTVFVSQVAGIVPASAGSVSVANYSFQNESGDKPLDWTILDAQDCMDGNTVSADRGYDGSSKSLKIDDTSGTLCSGVRSKAIPAVAGHYYESEIYCYIVSGTAAFYLEFWDGEGTRLSAESDTCTSLGSWQQLEANGAAPEGTVEITLLCYSLNGNVGVAYYDCAALDDCGIPAVANYDFQEADGSSKPLYWTVLNEADCMDGNTVSADRGYNSTTKSLKINDTSGTLCSGVRSDEIPATAGHFYESSVYCYVSSGTAQFYIEFWDSDDERISAESATCTTTGSWQKMEASGAAPEGTEAITLLCYSTLSNIGVSYYDYAALEDEGVLLPNGGMEISYANFKPMEWEFDPTDNTDDAFRSEAYVHNGNYSLCLNDGSSSDGIALRSGYFKATPGTTYAANGFIYNNSGAGWLCLEFWDASGTRIDMEPYVSNGTGTWHNASASSEAPANTVAVTALLYTSVSNTGQSYFDDISIDGLTSLEYVFSTDITSKKQFFADDYIIESMNGLTRTVNEGTKYGSVLLEPLKDWEGTATNATVLVNTVFYDNDISKYRMWYTTSYKPTEECYLCYAESSNGTTWERAEDGIITWGGESTNIVRIGPGEFFNSIYKAGTNNFKMFGWQGTWIESHNGYYALTSTNKFWDWGTTSRLLSGPSGYRDVSTMAYDASNSEYIAMVKYWPQTSQPRVMYTTKSDNFTSWSTPELSFACDDEDIVDGYDGITDVYGVSIYPTDGVYFGFPWIFYHYDDEANDVDGPTDVQLAFSRDGYLWSRPSREPVIPLGTGWEAGQIYGASYPIEVGNEVRLYYSGYSNTHAVNSPTSGISYASWRKDGFVSLNAGATEGVLVTKPVKFIGNSSLVINSDASGGSIKVEILDSSRNVISGYSKNDCDTMTTDSISHIVTWNSVSSISSLSGQNIRFRIYVTNAELYSIKTN